MIEKVNPSHPDKVADRIAGALVDLAYKEEENPKIAVEVLLGHGMCHIIVESSVILNCDDVEQAVKRIAGEKIKTDLVQVPQDTHLAGNQAEEVRCGDNGIFKGVPLTKNEKEISRLAKEIYKKYQYDGKYILTDDKFIVCQSNASNEELKQFIKTADNVELIVNPLGEWTGGTDVDTGATNRKLGSDMAQSVTGGGLHGKDLSKADVSINIYAFEMAQKLNRTISISCAIGDKYIKVPVSDTEVANVPYSEIVEQAKDYIKEVGGFEKFAEWGLY